jgi:hypothetical protein
MAYNTKWLLFIIIVSYVLISNSEESERVFHDHQSELLLNKTAPSFRSRVDAIVKDIDSLRLRIENAVTIHRARVEADAASRHLASMSQLLQKAGIQRKREIARSVALSATDSDTVRISELPLQSIDFLKKVFVARDAAVASHATIASIASEVLQFISARRFSSSASTNRGRASSASFLPAGLEMSYLHKLASLFAMVSSTSDDTMSMSQERISMTNALIREIKMSLVPKLALGTPPRIPAIPFELAKLAMFTEGVVFPTSDSR